MKIKLNVDENIYIINWRLSYKCNYNCSYCIQSGSENKKSISEVNNRIYKLTPIVSNFITEVKKIINKDIHLQLVGGEPSILDLDYIINNIDQNSISKLKLITNLSQPIEYYNSLISKFNRISFMCSLHEEFVDPVKFIDKVALLNADEKFIQFTVTSNNKHLIPLLVNLAKSKNCRVRFDANKLDKNKDILTKIIQKYSNDDKNIMYSSKSRAREILYNQKSTRYRCDAFRHQLTIKLDNDVQLCTSNNKLKLGNILDDDIISKFTNMLSQPDMLCDNDKTCAVCPLVSTIEIL